MAQIEAHDALTGETRLVPEHWVTSQAPSLVDRFTVTERQQAILDADAPPTRKATVAELRAYAAEHGIDLGDATLKDDIFDVIAGHVGNNGSAGNDGTGSKGA